MIFTDMTSLIIQVKNELGSIQNNFTDEQITNIANNALIIHNKILNGYNLSYVELPYSNGVITVDSNKQVYKVRYLDSNGRYRVVKYSDFVQEDDQLQIQLPFYVNTARVYYIENYTIDIMYPDNIQLAFVYLVCDLLIKQLANPYANIKSIADGIMNISYDTGLLNSPDNSRYMKQYYKLIYKESSVKGEV